MCLATACLAIRKACRLATLKDGLYERSSSEPGYSESKRQLRQGFHTLLHQFFLKKKWGAQIRANPSETSKAIPELSFRLFSSLVSFKKNLNISFR